VVLASVIQRYTFELKDKTPIELDPLITLRPKQNVYLKLVKR
jgi:hypothetical protein